MQEIKAITLAIIGGILILGCTYLNENQNATTKEESIINNLSFNTECDTIFTFGEKMPKFKNGDKDLLNYNFNTIAPIIGKSNKKNGQLISKLHYSLIISKEGKVIGAEILTEIEAELKTNLEKELLKMQNWAAGEINGKPKCMKIKIPISCIKWE